MILKYFTSSIGSFGFTYLMMNEFLEYKESIFEFLPDFIPFVILGISLYLGITYLIDKKTRKLFNLIISDVSKK